jgi:hypothetical protein
MKSLHLTCQAAAYGLPMVPTFSTFLGVLVLFQLSTVEGPSYEKHCAVMYGSAMMVAS